MHKTGALSVMGIVGATIAQAFGGWDAGIVTLLFFMAADYMTGVMVALVWHNSPKTENGLASSAAGLKGICKKCGTLLLVVIAVRLDITLGVTYLRDGVVIALALNELISLTENLGLMGVPIPPVIAKGIELLTQRREQDDQNRD